MKKLWAWIVLVFTLLAYIGYRFLMAKGEVVIDDYTNKIHDRNRLVDDIEKKFVQKIVQSKVIINSKKEELKQNTDKLKEIKEIENEEERLTKLSDLANSMGI